MNNWQSMDTALKEPKDENMNGPMLLLWEDTGAVCRGYWHNNRVWWSPDDPEGKVYPTAWKLLGTNVILDTQTIPCFECAADTLAHKDNRMVGGAYYVCAKCQALGGFCRCTGCGDWLPQSTACFFLSEPACNDCYRKCQLNRCPPSTLTR